MRLRHALSILAAPAFALGALTFSAFAQDFPTKPVHIVVPYAAGGGTDMIARTAADELSKMWGQPVIVDNRPGAGGNVGAEYVARQPADGYTLLMAINSFATNAILMDDLGYDPFNDFTAVSLVATAPNVVAVRESLDVDDIPGLIEYAKAHPGEATSGSGGAGSGSHLAIALFEHLTGVKLLHVPYKGIRPAVTDLVAGHIDLSFSVLAVVKPQADADRIKVLAAATAKRSLVAPDLPTVAEQGTDGFVVVSWFGIVAPKGMPQAVLDKIEAALQEIGKNEAVRQNLADRSIELVGSSAKEFGDFMEADSKLWAGIIETAGITLN